MASHPHLIGSGTSDPIAAEVNVSQAVTSLPARPGHTTSSSPRSTPNIGTPSLLPTHTVCSTLYSFSHALVAVHELLNASATFVAPIMALLLPYLVLLISPAFVTAQALPGCAVGGPSLPPASESSQTRSSDYLPGCPSNQCDMRQLNRLHLLVSPHCRTDSAHFLSMSL